MERKINQSNKITDNKKKTNETKNILNKKKKNDQCDFVDKTNILINWSKYKSYNYVKEEYEFFEKLKNNKNFIFKNFSSTDNLKLYIKNNINKNINLIFPTTARIFVMQKLKVCTKELISCLQYIKSFPNPICKAYFQTGDPFICRNNFDFYMQLFPSQNKTIKIIVGTWDMSDYQDNVTTEKTFSNKSRGKLYPIKILNDICNYSINYAYKYAFVPFNNNPINKVALGGTIDQFCYPSRWEYNYILQTHPDIYEKIEGNRNERLPLENGNVNLNFNFKLNKYIANIYTGVYKYKSFSLLKMFEILACGSLLLVEESQTNLCKKMGLIEDVHFIKLLKNEEKMIEIIKYILDNKNREKIDTIRKNGLLFCKNNFGVDLCYNKFISFFN